MNINEKVRRLGRLVYRVDVSSHGSENLQESNVLPDNFFSWSKEEHNVVSHLIRVRFQSTFLAINCQEFVIFSTTLDTVLLLSKYNAILKAEAKENWTRSLNFA